LNRYHLPSSSEPVLLILDEIADCPDINKTIQSILDLAKSYQIIIISSTLRNMKDFANHFYQLQLYPLDFEEYLTATGNEWYIEVIRSHFESDKALPEIVHKELLTYLEDYLQIGGMPAAVNEYVSMDSKLNVSEKHRTLIDSYLSDVNKQNIEGTSLKIHQVFTTIDHQLMKENRKFQYTMIRKGATQALYADALQYLQDTFYGFSCFKIGDDSIDQYPEENTAIQDSISSYLGFKLYMPDVGMLYSTLRTRFSTITEQMKKGILENYVMQSLTANGYPVCFWESSSQARVDFIIMKERRYIPIEVRINTNTRSKNISVFKTKCSQMKESVKISTKNFEYSNGVKYVPVYAVFCI
jgi:predicted AAA+ superfamily ATPase